MKRVALACVGALMFVALLASCGGSSSGEITDQARSELQPLVAEVRRAAESFDPDGAANALAGLRQAVAALHARQEIDSARAEAILTAAARVEARLSLTPTTTIPPTPPSSTAAPTSTTAPTATTEPATSTSAPAPSTTPLTQPPTTATSTPVTSAPEPTVDDGDDDGGERGRGNGEDDSSGPG
jgi:hypothetical protein